MSNKQMNITCDQYEVLIDGYLDGEIMPDEKLSVENHLVSCRSCKQYLDDTAKLLEKTAYLPKEVPLARGQKDALWKKIEQGHGKYPASNGLAPDGLGAAVKNDGGLNTEVLQQQAIASRSFFTKYRAPFAAASAVVVLVAAIFTVSRFTGNKEITNDKITTNIPLGAYWKVNSVKGTPAIDDKTVTSADSLGLGQWITTNDTSSAEISVANIGKFTVEPNSKVKLVKSDNGEHRIQVQYGTIDADINADPRSFFVDMPSVTAVDLGCSYKLTVDTLGDGLLYVKQGKVSLEAAGRESLVPSGKFCITKKDFGPGTPFQGDASPRLKKALMDFDFGNCAGTCVNVILKNAKKTDAVTLVSILPRVDANMKEMVYARVAGFVPPPRAYSYDSIPHINTEDLEKWIEKIQDEVQSKLEKNMEQMQSDLEKMNRDMDLNSKDWEEFGRNMQRFGDEFGKQFGKDFEKNFKYSYTPKAKNDDDNGDSVYFNKKQFRQDMEEMRKGMEEMKNQFDSEQFKREMEQSKEEMKRSKEEMKRANEEIKNAMKEMKKNMKFDFENSFDSTNHKMKIKIWHYDKDNKDGNYEEEFEVPDVNEVPEIPEVPDVNEVPETPEKNNEVTPLPRHREMQKEDKDNGKDKDDDK